MAGTQFPNREDHRVYAITDCEGRTADEVVNDVAACLAGGATVIQYRDKRNKDQTRRQIGLEIRRLCDAAAASFIVNDDLALAIDVKADGIHLGKNDLDCRKIRDHHQSDLIIGVSCYASISRAIQAQQDGADYIAFGSVFPSPTKPHAPQCPLSVLRDARDQLSMPIVAIGGITTENADEALESGANYLAVINGIFGANDVKLATQAFVEVTNAFSAR